MIVILGGGLSGSLLAYRLSQIDPRPEFLLVEAKNRLGGEHTWSFHENDLSPDSMNWIRELVTSSWDQQEVRFPDFTRVLSQRYHSVTSSHLNQVISHQIRNHCVFGQSVLRVDPHHVCLENTKIEAEIVFDARGLDQHPIDFCGFQKFVGMDLELENPHELEHPIIMDANCEQKEGYRFFYLLPWSRHSVLIEDTRYSSSPQLNVEEFKGEIRDYCRKSGWKIQKELRCEIGALPIPLSPFKPNSEASRSICIGIRGGYFHRTTGYSFLYAVRIAEVIAHELERNRKAESRNIIQALEPIQTQLRKQSRYFALLNRMLFLAGHPTERWRIFDRFYHLNEDLIHRFYRGNLKITDQARILFGRPPVPVYSALKSALCFHRYADFYGKQAGESPQ